MRHVRSREAGLDSRGGGNTADNGDWWPGEDDSLRTRGRPSDVASTSYVHTRDLHIENRGVK